VAGVLLGFLLAAGVGEATDPLSALVRSALQGSSPSEMTLEELLRRLRLAQRITTAPPWLPSPERLVSVDRSGEIIGVVDGSRSEVAIDSRLDERLFRSDERVVLIHTTESQSEPWRLGTVGKPGVRAIVAIGHDGSLYAASRGTGYVSLQVGRPPVRFGGFLLPGHISVVKFLASARMEVTAGQKAHRRC
jgi:hypothetical protein